MSVYNVEISHLTQIYQNTRVQELEATWHFAGSSVFPVSQQVQV